MKYNKKSLDAQVGALIAQTVTGGVLVAEPGEVEGLLITSKDFRKEFITIPHEEDEEYNNRPEPRGIAEQVWVFYKNTPPPPSLSILGDYYANDFGPVTKPLHEGWKKILKSTDWNIIFNELVSKPYPFVDKLVRLGSEKKEEKSERGVINPNINPPDKKDKRPELTAMIEEATTKADWAAIAEKLCLSKSQWGKLNKKELEIYVLDKLQNEVG